MSLWETWLIVLAVACEIGFLLYARQRRFGDHDTFYRTMFVEHLKFGTVYLTLTAISIFFFLEAVSWTTVVQVALGYSVYFFLQTAWVLVPLLLAKKGISLNILIAVYLRQSIEQEQLKKTFDSHAGFQSVKEDRFRQLLALKLIKECSLDRYQLTWFGKILGAAVSLANMIYGVQNYD